ncbi:hypothetical protein BXU10_20810 [Flavobacterium sp. LM4]|nr:hypothetical protein BXU10_20810 [Flavobacterium sp. LM4]
MKIFDFFKSKKKNLKLIKVEKESPLINTLINHHFCIKDSNNNEILKVLNASYTEKVLVDNKFNWNFLFDEKTKNFDKQFLLFDKINEWNYLRWNVWDFEETKKMTLILSKELNTKVYYFFIDPWICTCRWIMADKGQLIESYFESHEKFLNEDGNWEFVNKPKNKQNKQEKAEFWEDKFWKLYKRSCQPIDIINHRQNISAIKGELK